MTLNARDLGSEVEVAHHGRDHDTHRVMLARLVALAQGPDLGSLSPHGLEEHRNALLVRLAAVHDHLQAIGRTRKGMLASGLLRPDGSQTWPAHEASLDPSN